MKGNTFPIYGVNYSAGDFYFVYTDNSFISRGIAWFEYRSEIFLVKNKVSHVGIVIGEGRGISATSKGIAVEDLNECFDSKHRHIFFREVRDITFEQRTKLIEFAHDNLGRKYDWPLIAGFALINSTVGRMLPESMRMFLLKKFNSYERLVCSEFASEALNFAKVISLKNTLLCPSDLIMLDIWKNFKFK
jgi:hypothetical protein